MDIEIEVKEVQPEHIKANMNSTSISSENCEENSIDLLFSDSISNHSYKTVTVDQGKVVKSLTNDDIFKLSILNEALDKGWKVSKCENGNYVFDKKMNSRKINVDVKSFFNKIKLHFKKLKIKKPTHSRKIEKSSQKEINIKIVID